MTTEPTHIDIYSRLGVVEGKLDLLITHIAADTALHAEKLNTHDARLTSLEKWRWVLAGMAVVIPAIHPKLLNFLGFNS